MKLNRRQSRTSVLSSLMVLVFAALYLLFSVGVLKATHFCMGREASIAYFTAEAHQCACNIIPPDGDDCCDDQQGLLRIDVFQKSLSIFELSPPALPFLGALYGLPSSEPRCARANHRPLFETQPPPKILYKVFCSFVFYDDGSMV